MYYAHSQNTVGHRHRLVDHLTGVAMLAERFAQTIGCEAEARLTGLLHDLGKYGDRFQKRLEGEDHGLDHWSLGAHLALYKYGSVAAALAIQGHHIGLQNLTKQDLTAIDPKKLSEHHPLQLALSEADPQPLLARFEADGLVLNAPAKRLIPGELKSGFDTLLDIRLLFSALVDADFLDTEAHFQGGLDGKRYRPTGLDLDAQAALDRVLAHIDHLSKRTQADSQVAAVRQTVLSESLKAATLSPGLFTLTAPTGSGKTLAMLAFALKHALTHGLRRIILVVPYLSIIEQTAAIYRALLGDDAVLEHHSLAGLGVEQQTEDDEGQQGLAQERRRRLLSENWDAPIILTTSVQMLESMFSNRPSACRKLHRLPGSVILFDEVQTLPAGLVLPTLASLSHLAHRYNSSVVFATATQPAFEHLHERVQAQVASGWQPRPLVPQPERLFTPLRRVQRTWGDVDEPLSWSELAQKMAEAHQVLCIVNLKRQARDLWQTLDDPDSFHLSTALCPAHRQRLLAEIRQRLRNDEPVRLIATQCIEAGVDVDFPQVFRAYGPLEAILQAEGRCNREGRRPQPGQMHIFLPEEAAYPPGGYEQATQLTQILLRRLGPDGMALDDPHFITAYYRELYDLARPENTRKTRVLLEAVQSGSFPEVAKHYRIIENDSINVIVPYGEALDAFADIQHLAEKSGLTGELMHKARPLTVGLFRPKEDDPVWDSLLEVQSFKQGRRSRQESWYIAAKPEHYHPHLGYQPPAALNVWIG